MPQGHMSFIKKQEKQSSYPPTTRQAYPNRSRRPQERERESNNGGTLGFDIRDGEGQG
jgi:hypothetical protein